MALKTAWQDYGPSWQSRDESAFWLGLSMGYVIPECMSKILRTCFRGLACFQDSAESKKRTGPVCRSSALYVSLPFDSHRAVQTIECLIYAQWSAVVRHASTATPAKGFSQAAVDESCCASLESKAWTLAPDTTERRLIEIYLLASRKSLKSAEYLSSITYSQVTAPHE